MLALIVLFAVFSPGFLLSIPPIGGTFFMTGKTSTVAVIVHALVFGLVIHLLRTYYPEFLAEGFVTRRPTTKPSPFKGVFGNYKM